jgi:hypothetical protein
MARVKGRHESKRRNMYLLFADETAGIAMKAGCAGMMSCTEYSVVANTKCQSDPSTGFLTGRTGQDQAGVDDRQVGTDLSDSAAIDKREERYFFNDVDIFKYRKIYQKLPPHASSRARVRSSTETKVLNLSSVFSSPFPSQTICTCPSMPQRVPSG